MSFKANLFELLDRADKINMDGYEVDDDMLTLMVSAGPSYYVVDLAQYDMGEFKFFDQEVLVSSDGYVEAVTDGLVNDGESVSFYFGTTKPITEEDL